MILEKYFETLQIVLKEQPIGKTLYVNLIKPVITKYGKSFVLYDKMHNVFFFSNSLLYSYLSKALNELQNKDGIYFKDEKLTEILTFKIKSVDKNKNGQIQVKLDFIKNKPIKYKTKILTLSDDEKQEKAVCKVLAELSEESE